MAWQAVRHTRGPEYVSGKLMERAERQGIALSHIQPGKPQQNAYVERYNRTVRHEWLDQHIIESIKEAQEFATQWLWHRRHHTRTETENGRVNSTVEPC